MKNTEAGQNLACFLASAEACALHSQRLEVKPFSSENSHPVHESQTNLGDLEMCMHDHRQETSWGHGNFHGGRKEKEA